MKRAVVLEAEMMLLVVSVSKRMVEWLGELMQNWAGKG